MPLFQKSVINKYISGLDKEAVKDAWARYQSHFFNPTIQANIRDAKEEEYQEGFVRDLFVNILGYTLKPQPDYNFVLEKKTETDATKSDGALLHGDRIVGVVELKDTGTAELDKIEKQVFSYKHKHKNCVYIITSNFEKLRFYINDATEYEEFDLFNLTAYRFTVLYVCLQQQHIQKNIPLAIKNASVAEEENVTKKLYADYSGFKRQLFSNIVTLNPQYNKLDLFKKTQKLLDRLLFIFFAEDRLLLPPNSIRQILRQWEQLKELDNYVSLYSRFIKYFGYLNTGYVGKQEEIFAYNGGLFEPDEILDNLQIDDAVLHAGSFAISHYDFDSEVDVNILGHIFEHSLSEIEEVQAQLEGHAIDKTKTKRKKDGVFYTPRYITKYIVENTVGELCRQQKEKLGVIDDAFTPQKRKANTKQLQQKLEDYRNWLLHITICDPACGSGAFLNQALDFLIEEHRLIDELTARLFGSPMVLSDVETAILENNIFGVDINEEAVEIARLSLWLRTARMGRKLNNLSHNIKCGNSLIDDPVIAGAKAFNWQQEFASVFDRGDTFSKGVTSAKQAGFDVVIGNPPYVSSKGDNHNEAFKHFWLNSYKTAVYQIDTYILFIELGLKLIQSVGISSFIIPNALMNNVFMTPVRKFLLQESSIIEIVKTPKNTFSDANVDTVIIVLEKCDENNFVTFSELFSDNYKIDGQKKQSSFLKDDCLLVYRGSSHTDVILEKAEKNCISLYKILSIARGVGIYHKRVGHTKEFISRDPFFSEVKKDDTFVPYLRGKNVNRYETDWQGNSFISYGDWLAEPREPKYFRDERIILRQIPGLKNLYSTFINSDFVIDQSVFIGLNEKLQFETKYICSLINSRFFSWFFRTKYSEFDELFPKIKLAHFKDFPIKQIEKSQQLPFITKADIMLSKNKELQQVKQQLQQLLLGKYNGLTLSKKLQDWPSLTFAAFLKELQKQKIKLSLPEEAEWMKYFEEQKAIANSLQQVIDTTDKEIDKMVYELYGLTDEEVKIVEGS